MNVFRFGTTLALLLASGTAFAQGMTEPPATAPGAPPPSTTPPSSATAPAPTAAPIGGYEPAPLPPPVAPRSDEKWSPPEKHLAEQGSWALLVDWDLSLPVGSFHDYIANLSFRGLGVEGRFFALPNVSIGIGGSWNLYDQTRDYTVYPLDAGAVYAKLYREMSMFAIRFTAHYYPTSKGPVKPYFGVGMGPSSVYFQTLAADLVITKTEWYFTLQPEAGVFIGIDDPGVSYGVNLSLRYTWMPATFNEVTNVQTIGGQVGIYTFF